MKVQYLWWTFICLLSLAAPLTSMAESPSQPLTLEEAIASALKHNPRVMSARHEVAAAGFQVTTARSGLMPQLYLSERFNRTNSPLWAFGTKLNQGIIETTDFNPDRLNEPDAINNFNTALSLNWNLFDGGQTWIGWRQSQQGQRAAELSLRRSEQQTIALVAKAYMELLLAVENHGVIAQSLKTSRAHFKLVQDRFRSGISVKSDVLRAQVRIADLEQKRLMSHSRIQVAQAMLHAAMGQPDAARIVPTSPFERCVPPKESLTQWIDRALEKRPDLKQLDIQKLIAEKGVKRARSGHWPTFSLQGSYELNSEDLSKAEDNYTVGAMLRMNLYSGQRISSQTAEAKAMVAKLNSLRNSFELNVRVETQRSFYQAQSAWQSIAVSRSAITQAEESLRIVSNRFASGLLTIVDLLDAQTALQQVRIQLFTALHDYKVARIELALAAGIIDKNFE
ncbi:MAG: TolC family protein [Thermodesulfobacteriota bacterium]|nr:TolC family protein [Thermodesulfobacteriota bacterium]